MNQSKHAVRCYLRPISLIDIGTESDIDRKAEVVDTITAPFSTISFEQHESFPLRWGNENGIHTKNRDVEFPERHWWVVSHGLLESSDPPLQHHADIFDFILALNLCIDDPVFFSQNPGQTVGGAYRIRKQGLDYRGDLSAGNFGLAMLASHEIPEKVEISRDIGHVYRMVRTYRSIQLTEDADMDIRVALHMYEDALTSTIWTRSANLYYTCENVLWSGDIPAGAKDAEIASVSGLSKTEARRWRRLVNRIKHPDEGHSTGILDESFEIPSSDRLRNAASDALLHTMTERFETVDTRGG